MGCSLFSFLHVTLYSSPLLLGANIHLSTHFENIPCLFLILGVRDQQNIVLSRRMRWAGHVARMGEGRGVHRVLVRKPEGKRQLGRPRRKWEDNIKIDLQEVGGGCGD